MEIINKRKSIYFIKAYFFVYRAKKTLLQLTKTGQYMEIINKRKSIYFVMVLGLSQPVRKIYLTHRQNTAARYYEYYDSMLRFSRVSISLLRLVTYS